MEFRLLGPLEVWDAGQALQLRGSKRRALLALLALNANEVVRSGRLIEELWGERPPANAPAALQNHISRLRKELGAELVVTKPWGYVLRAEPEAIDLRRFEALVRDAKPLPAAERGVQLAEALALWRGPALADLANEPALAVERARLDELRLVALEQRIDAALELGEHEQLVPELESLVAEHPLRERLRGQLILTLYRSGRQAEALETYRETRRLLVEELGIEPSPELRELERAILCQDPALAPAPAQAPAEAPPSASDRWHWPRSPLALGVGLLALAIAGAAVAVVVTRDGPATPDATPAVAAAPATAPTLEPPTTAAHIAAPPPRATAPATTTPSEPAAEPTLVHHVAAASRPHTSLATHTQGVEPQPPTRPAPPPPPPPAPPAPPAHVLYRLRDDFSGNSMNTRLWKQSVLGTGVDVSQPLGWLEIGLDANSAPDSQFNAIEGKYESTCTLHSDFDARLEYVLLDWPIPSGVVVSLSAFSYSGPPYLAAEITRTSEAVAPQGEYYSGWVSPRHGADLPLGDLSGTLRIGRVNGLVTDWFWRSGRWVKLVSARVKDPLTLALRVWTNGTEFRHQHVRIALDNFVVTANQFSCPLGTKPERL